MVVTLDEIGQIHGTDKSSLGHDYLRFYEHFFEPFRHKPVTIVEIGVLAGASLRTWRDYFPFARIVGMDIDPTCLTFEGERIEVIIGDQFDTKRLNQLIELNPIVVIDDAGHMPKAQVFTYMHMVPYLTSGSLYIVEDLPPGGFGPSLATDWLINVARFVLQRQFHTAEDSWIAEFGDCIESMAFYRECCITWLR